jgi:hypothetical protein
LITGGTKTVTNKRQGWPQFEENAIWAVEAVLRSCLLNYWTGKQGMELEKQFAEWQGNRCAFAVESAPVWKVRWPQGHTERAFQGHNAFGRTGFPFESKNTPTRPV